MSYTHDQQAESQSDELFGEVISTYTDAEAVEDGFLAELHTGTVFQGLPINRMPAHLFDDLLPFVEAEAALFDGNLNPAIACILRTKCSFAQGPDIATRVKLDPTEWHLHRFRDIDCHPLAARRN
jgi:hypothetical protein